MLQFSCHRFSHRILRKGGRFPARHFQGPEVNSSGLLFALKSVFRLKPKLCSVYLPQFIVIHTVKGFGIVKKAERDVFLELSCFFHDLADVGNLISGSSAFSKTSLNIRKFTVHVLLKPGLFFFHLKQIHMFCKSHGFEHVSLKTVDGFVIIYFLRFLLHCSF